MDPPYKRSFFGPLQKSILKYLKVIFKEEEKQKTTFLSYLAYLGAI